MLEVPLADNLDSAVDGTTNHPHRAALLLGDVGHEEQLRFQCTERTPTAGDERTRQPAWRSRSTINANDM